MRKMAQALVLVVVCIGLAACATNREPTYGERIQDEGSSLKAVGEQWSKGDELVKKGEKRIENGQKKIREGERMIEEGRDMISEGSKLMRDAKLNYEQWDGPGPPPKN
jgi:predicted small secreted protein